MNKLASNELAVFAKYWRPGQVKTRLSASLGEQAAAGVYHQFVRTLLARLAGAADRRTVVFSPPQRASEFAQAGGAAWRTRPQSSGDLGLRMRCFFETALDDGAERVVLIGSDSPNLPLRLIDEAFAALAQHSVVLGPAEDGGYYLIGVTGSVPSIFEGVAWSTRDVWRQTIDRLERSGDSYHTLPPWYDVDDLDDLKRLHRELASAEQNDDALRELREVVEPALASASTDY